MPDLTITQWALTAVAAIVIGFSKSGLPGSGILAVPLMANVLAGPRAVGATLPLLIVGDVCALVYHRRDVEWSHLRRLAPSVVVGLLIGTAIFVLMSKDANRWINPVVGVVVLLMLGLSQLRGKFGDRLAPTTPIGIKATGVVAGVTTMIANAAGPVMAIYMTATGMGKKSLMSTTVWYFFIFNLTKAPLQLFVTLYRPNAAMIDATTIRLDLLMVPVVIAGAVIGKASFDHIPQTTFNRLILILAAVASIKLLFT